MEEKKVKENTNEKSETPKKPRKKTTTATEKPADAPKKRGRPKKKPEEKVAEPAKAAETVEENKTVETTEAVQPIETSVETIEPNKQVENTVKKMCQADNKLKMYKYGVIALAILSLLLCFGLCDLTNKLNKVTDSNPVSNVVEKELSVSCEETGVKLVYTGLSSWYTDQNGYVYELKDDNEIAMIGQVLVSSGVAQEDYDNYIAMLSESYTLEEMQNVKGYKIKPVADSTDTNYILSDEDNCTVFEVFFEGQSEEVMNKLEESFKVVVEEVAPVEGETLTEDIPLGEITE